MVSWLFNGVSFDLALSAWELVIREVVSLLGGTSAHSYPPVPPPVSCTQTYSSSSYSSVMSSSVFEALSNISLAVFSTDLR